MTAHSWARRLRYCKPTFPKAALPWTPPEWLRRKKGGCATRDALRLALFPPEAAGGGVEPALESAAEAGHVGVTQIFGHGGCRVVRQAE